VNTLRHLWTIGLALSLLPFAVWTATRLLGVERGYPSMQLMAFTPYVAGASLLPLLAALASRLWWHAAVAAVLVIALAACVLPRAVPGSSPGSTGPGPQLRVLTANLYIGAADPQALVALVRTLHIDVLATQELTPEAALGLDAAGLSAVLPYRAAYPRPGGSGSGLYSRYPLSAPGLRTMPRCHVQAHATLALPGARPVSVESAHPCSPADATGALQWATEIAAQPAATPSDTPRLLLGDFNATLDHGGLRTLLATGYRDAAASVGDGLAPTWPFVGGGTFHGIPIPPITIDHVLADPRIGVLAVSVHPVPGSDHRAVYAELTLPPS
jgi:endonuclease/exonuclease/phosphatase (EEP) superfamily protein YafD